MDGGKIGWYTLRSTAAGLEVRSRPTLCSWLRRTDPPVLLTAADVALATRAELTRGRPHRSPKPRMRRFHVAFFDSRGERVGPRFHFALENDARRFAAQVAPSGSP